MTEHIDEQIGLAVLGGGGFAPQRQADVAADVNEHAPEQAVADVVQAGETEQLLGFEQIDAEYAFGEEGDRQPAGFGKRRQQQ